MDGPDASGDLEEEEEEEGRRELVSELSSRDSEESGPESTDAPDDEAPKATRRPRSPGSPGGSKERGPGSKSGGGARPGPLQRAYRRGELLPIEISLELGGGSHRADDLEPVLFENQGKSLPQQRFVFSDHYPHGISILRFVPAPTTEVTVSEPPTASTRSTRPPSPRPSTCAPPTPVSVTDTRSTSSTRATVTVTRSA